MELLSKFIVFHPICGTLILFSPKSGNLTTLPLNSPSPFTPGDSSLGDKKGIRRFAHASVPFDDSLVSVTLDLSGRPYFVFRGEIPKSKVGEFDVELAEEFFKSLANSIKCNLHIELKYGTNLHHNIEAMFKAVGIALDEATSIDTRSKAIPSTKGTL